MKSKLEKRKKNKRAFILVSVISIVLSIFFHILCRMTNSHFYWPIFPMFAMGLVVIILGVIVFMNEYEAREEEINQVHKSSAPNLIHDSQEKLTLKQTATSNIAYNESDLV